MDRTVGVCASNLRVASREMRRLFANPLNLKWSGFFRVLWLFIGSSLLRQTSAKQQNLGISHTSWHFFVADLDTTAGTVRVASTHHFVRGVSVDGRERSV
jgi:hypothetical protein